jgi:hypothetical protein
MVINQMRQPICDGDADGVLWSFVKNVPENNPHARARADDTKTHRFVGTSKSKKICVPMIEGIKN